MDVTPGVGDIKGLLEVFTGCDVVTGENLGAWRWAGLIFLSEARQLRRLGDGDVVIDLGRHGDNVALPQRVL